MIAIFLQARLASSRLPGKALLKLADIPVIVHAMRALNAVKADVRSLLTTQDAAPALKPLAEAEGWELFTGPEEDVLARYVFAARKYGADRIVRATGDNPLVSAAAANAILHLAQNADYAGFTGIPLGSGVEILRTAALEEAFAEANDVYEREHVAPFLYRRPLRYRIFTPAAAPEMQAPNSRITLDTQEDYRYLSRLFTHLYRNRPLEIEDIAAWLKAHPHHAG
ncbi:MAG: hypothetical protein B0D92_04880 [Spirochaeta sp. LUC14_002_19_P3]|nr:MAG: hypothetical protein B0D92_04880 [Spirochaeta sp. LUC14_002_19_P3]